MRIAKPILLVTTPLGMLGGLHEAYRLTGGLAVLMAMMMGLMCVAAASIVLTVRREAAADRAGKLSHAAGAKDPQ
jgi:ABC-type xylose transport system permease subunit